MKKKVDSFLDLRVLSIGSSVTNDLSVVWYCKRGVGRGNGGQTKCKHRVARKKGYDLRSRPEQRPLFKHFTSRPSAIGSFSYFFPLFFFLLIHLSLNKDSQCDGVHAWFFVFRMDSNTIISIRITRIHIPRGLSRLFISFLWGGGEICYAIGWEKNVRRREGGEWSRRGAKRSGISGTIGLSSFLVARSTPTRGWQPLNNRRSHVEVRYSYDHREPFSSGDTQLKSLIIQPLARALSVLPIAYNYIAAR